MRCSICWASQPRCCRRCCWVAAEHATQIMASKENLRLGLKQQRDHHHRQGAIFPAPRFDLLLPDRADARMKNSLETLACGRIAENPARQFVAPQLAVPSHHLTAKRRCDLRQRLPAGQASTIWRAIASVSHHGNISLRQRFRRCGFPHANAPGQAIDFHGNKVIAIIDFSTDVFLPFPKPQGGFVTKPRVASSAKLPWVSCLHFSPSPPPRGERAGVWGMEPTEAQPVRTGRLGLSNARLRAHGTKTAR